MGEPDGKPLARFTKDQVSEANAYIDEHGSPVLRCTFVGVDDWSRCLIKTERGTMLCDTECLDPSVIKANPNRGHWHTITADWGEPVSAIKREFTIELTEQ